MGDWARFLRWIVRASLLIKQIYKNAHMISEKKCLTLNLIDENINSMLKPRVRILVKGNLICCKDLT